jgi:hypothetical protein
MAQRGHPRWQPGQSGNPNGRPKGTLSLADSLRRYGVTETPNEMAAKMALVFPAIKNHKTTIVDVIAMRALVAAAEGESWAVNFVAERLDGKVTLPVLVENKTVTIGAMPADIAIEDM